MSATDESHASLTSAIQPEEYLFENSDAYFQSLIHDIEHATTSVDLETFIFNFDVLGTRIVIALSNAAKRGVAVRVLVDGAGSPFWSTTYAKILENANAKTKVFHPFPWQLWNWSRSVVKTPILFQGIYLLLKANSRNHRKICLIDRTIAYISSANISQCHLNIEDGGQQWRDFSLRLNHVPLDELYEAFDIAWTHRGIQERIRDAFRAIRKEPRVRLNYTRHRRRILYKNLLRRIRLCQRRIWITNAYFVPDNFLLKRLKTAANQGVDVRILLPKKSDVRMMPWASSTFYHSLLQSGVKLYEYLPSMLHAKALILDDWALLGSSNLNHRSLLHDLEADVTLFSDHAKKQLAQFFLDDLARSRELKLANWKNSRPWYQRFLGQIVLYIKYWI
ncbi:MAG: cardiolipin synthase B [Gammaproteobacteria bacterium RIFCSPLOWO2_02_FULL_42_14]|nr:MAG: cardiolipin synthase B [Gammaproteobacteria bacterium RIFCSPHIGHO2_02_FULL_42_43]OGT28885.1 MAG: cardiolipin synthase B [Gammaproteobacteria bacterium RIFCSPHIGHO2_01_FULL_42_8]OGT51952.1 MAG: cardiolipin synthase B [Gammaproteobacteria bacterium RIFCSPHIGHO2_12_FULL_41_25]OGT61057.1 MAG: cardiolipin synthase B [Gammaproteobacteria bacterium RIFCSPLOWO2_02_FULL_42_14]OGT86984.1 MAG: cardiolipin synthase B [Gammaproteobacteria bacterium RIFCSPLOWO2_12_FULL_42_18]